MQKWNLKNCVKNYSKKERKITCSFEYLVRDFLGCTFSISLNDSTLFLDWSCLWLTIWDDDVVNIAWLLLLLLLMKLFFLKTVWEVDCGCSLEAIGSLKFSSHWKSFLSLFSKWIQWVLYIFQNKQILHLKSRLIVISVPTETSCLTLELLPIM